MTDPCDISLERLDAPQTANKASCVPLASCCLQLGNFELCTHLCEHATHRLNTSADTTDSAWSSETKILQTSDNCYMLCVSCCLQVSCLQPDLCENAKDDLQNTSKDLDKQHV